MTPSNQNNPTSKISAKAEATFFRPQDALFIHHGHLPHWRQDRVTYFVTTRLADSMPQEKLREWQSRRDAWLAAYGIQKPSELKNLPEDQQHEFHATFTLEWHQRLDAGFGECWLRRADVREILIHRLLAETSLDAWVIMPNHLHAILAPEDQGLGEVMQHWKGGSAFEINRLLGRSGLLWQKESYDHIVRSEVQLMHFRRYIAENPIKARLEPQEYAVGHGSQRFKVASALAESLSQSCG
jgi:REP element-mobilizing transposase RayT